MSTFEILMPKLGESVEEATITKWFVKEGDSVEEDQVLIEIATDKVDSEIPSPVGGVVQKIMYQTDDVVPVGAPIAIIAIGGEGTKWAGTAVGTEKTAGTKPKNESVPLKVSTEPESDSFKSSKFYSPLVKSIAKKENISLTELDSIHGSGKDNRVTRNDVLNYLSKNKGGTGLAEKAAESKVFNQGSEALKPVKPQIKAPEAKTESGDKVVEMDRMRKLIADHMVMSKQVSPHVTSIIEADVTNLVLWRNNYKNAFFEKYGIKLTFMPVFTQAVAKALRDFPGINASVNGDQIIIRKNVNVGIAVALPSGNLIVPVVKQADQKNLIGLATDINRMAALARINKLSPDDIQGGTFTITNFGSFQNLIGTPIINQPQVAILATGIIEKKPAVIETPTGDVIAIRHKMYLSLSYDHRVVDGSLGGQFLRRIGDYLEEWSLDAGI